MMTRKERLFAMKGEALILVADKLKVKVKCNKSRTQLKEAKAEVIERILAAEAEIKSMEEYAREVREQFTTEEEITTEEMEEIEEIIARMACGETFDSATQAVFEKSASKAPISQSKGLPSETKENAKVKAKKANLKLSELTYKGETKSIREWAAELGMPWATLYDRVNRNGWNTEEAIETPLGQKRKKSK